MTRKCKEIFRFCDSWSLTKSQYFQKRAIKNEYKVQFWSLQKFKYRAMLSTRLKLDWKSNLPTQFEKSLVRKRKKPSISSRFSSSQKRQKTFRSPYNERKPTVLSFLFIVKHKNESASSVSSFFQRKADSVSSFIKSKKPSVSSVFKCKRASVSSVFNCKKASVRSVFKRRKASVSLFSNVINHR